MLSNNTFLETRIQWLFDGLFFAEKGFGVHVQCMLKMSRYYTLTEIFQQNICKIRRKIWDLIYYHGLTNYRFGAYLIFLLKYIMRLLLAQLTPLRSEKN